MIASKFIATAVAIAMANCVTPQARAATPSVPVVQTQPVPSGPKALPQRNVTRFGDGLRCMDDMMYRFGVRDVSMMIEEMQDQSRRLGAGTRDMMVSAIADMTRRSRGVRLVTFGSDNQNVVQLLSIAQRLNDFKVVPQYDIRGSITQFDEDVTRKQASLGVSLLPSLFGARVSSAKDVSVLGFDASVVTTGDLALVPGASSKNTVVVTRDDKGVGDGQAQIHNGNLSFSFDVAHNEGVAQALRNMIELSTIELTGKLLRLPYWGCLNINVADPEVQREMEDWFLSMQGTPELTRFVQEQLRNRKFYDGPADGIPNAATNDALTAHRRALAMGDASELDFELFKAFLLRPIPKAPEKPFAAEKVAPGQPGAAATTPAGKEIKLSVRVAKTRYRKGEPIELTVTTAQSGYVYCYVQSPTTGKIQRIFPNRFMRDPRLGQHAARPRTGFKMLAGGRTSSNVVGCLATEREVTTICRRAALGDFKHSARYVRRHPRAFALVAKGPVSLEGALIDVSDK
jgi:curli biogenesis system outer membrane secretion channel CsgG